MLKGLSVAIAIWASQSKWLYPDACKLTELGTISSSNVSMYSIQISLLLSFLRLRLLAMGSLLYVLGQQVQEEVYEETLQQWPDLKFHQHI